MCLNIGLLKRNNVDKAIFCGSQTGVRSNGNHVGRNHAGRFMRWTFIGMGDDTV